MIPESLDPPTRIRHQFRVHKRLNMMNSHLLRVPRVGRALPCRIGTRGWLSKFAAEHSMIIVITLGPAVAETTSVIGVSVQRALYRVIDLTPFFLLFFVCEHRGSRHDCNQFLQHLEDVCNAFQPLETALGYLLNLLA